MPPDLMIIFKLKKKKKFEKIKNSNTALKQTLFCLKIVAFKFFEFFNILGTFGFLGKLVPIEFYKF